MTDYAMDFSGSLLWKQAENRLHTQRGLLAYLMSPRTVHSSEEKKIKTKKEIETMISKMFNEYGTSKTHVDKEV